MKKGILIVMILVLTVSVFGQEKPMMGQEIEQLEKKCDRLFKTQIGVLDLQEIQENMFWIRNLVSKPSIKEQMMDEIFNSKLQKDILICWLTNGSNLWVCNSLSDQEIISKVELKIHIKNSSIDDLNGYKTLQNLDRVAFLKELEQKLCE